MPLLVQSPQKGVVHQFLGPNNGSQFPTCLTAFEHTPNSSASPSSNIIIFIGGLSDGLLSVFYPTSIAASLPPNWSLAQVLLSSSYAGWGTSSLKSDAAELSHCVSYFRTIKVGKIVLLGHSTGCQDVMEYLTGPGHEARPNIDGGIIQAPASDRHALTLAMDAEILKNSCAVAQAMVDNGNGEEILPSKASNNLFSAPICARRWLSLASPNHDGDDDYFSSDLTDEQLMGSFGTLPKGSPLCVLISGSDEYFLGEVDKEVLLKRWTEIARKGEGNLDEKNSGVLVGASHNLNGNSEEVVDRLVKKVVGFVNDLGLPS